MGGNFSHKTRLYRLFQSKSDDYLYFYIINLWTPRLKHGFKYTITI